MIEKYSDAYSTIQFGLQPPVTNDDVERGIELILEGNEMLEGIAEVVAGSDCL